MANKQSVRAKRQEKKRQEQVRSRLIWGAVIIVVLGLASILVRNATRPPAGREFPIMPADHLSTDEPLPTYNSNPPTSGPHFSQGLDPGFYDLSDVAEISTEPVGHLVHNLEHGYIILWYNCDILSDAECETLKADLQDYLGSSLISKQIAFPWSGTEYPVVLTSWGRMLEMESFDAADTGEFASANRLLAPEPNAP